MKAYNIIWDVDESLIGSLDYPNEVQIPKYLCNKEEIKEWLIEKYDCWIYGFSIK